MPGEPLTCVRCGIASPDALARRVPGPAGTSLAPLCDECHELYLAWVEEEHPEWLRQ